LRDTASNADFKNRLAGLLAGGPPGRNPLSQSAIVGQAGDASGRAMTMASGQLGGLARKAA